MKRLLQIALLALGSHGALAAERAAHYEAALARAGAAGKDIVVFQRGSDWNRLGERLFAGVWMKPEFAAAVGDDFVLVDVDRPEVLGGPSATSLKASVQPNLPLPPNEITAIESKGGARFKPRDDTALVAEGSSPAKDTLLLKLAPRHSGSIVRLDFPTDSTLPGNGPGRAPNGNFAIQEVEILSGTSTLKPRAVWASKHYGRNGAWQLADGIADKDDNYWNASAHEHEPRTLLIMLPQPATAKAEVRLRLVCGINSTQHVPGCLRGAVLSDAALESSLLTVSAAEDLAAHNAKFTWRGDDVPRVALLDREGRAVASDDGPRSNLTPASLAARVRELQKKRLRRDELWAAADKTQGPAKAELLRQSLNLLGLGNSTGHEKAYAFVHEQIKAADPGDESGVQRWLQFSADPRGVPKLVSDALKLAGEKKYEEALAALDRELADPRNRILDHDRLQRIMLGRFHVYRTWPGHEEQRYDELRKIAALDPDTYHGIGATGYLNMHFLTPVPEFAYYGWGASQVKAGANAWNLKICNADFLDHAGAYTLRISHAGGKDALKIHRVALIENGKETFQTIPDTSLAPKGKTEIPLVVKAWDPARKPTLRLELEAAEGKTDCAGRIEFEPLLELPSAR